MRRGALLHDIGKMGILDDILHKPGPLTADEFEIVKCHPNLAYELLSPISFLNKAIEIPYSHHEKWDGTGYPQGLKGRQIPISARIFAIVDAWPRDQVVDYIVAERGKHFDPRVLDTFLDLIVFPNSHQR